MYYLILVVLSVTLWCANGSAPRDTPDSFVSLWNVSRPAAQSPQLTAAEGLLFVSDVEAGWAVVHAFDALSGRLVWRWNSSWWGEYDLPGLIPIVSSQAPDVIFIVQPYGTTMVALDLSTGSVRWSFSGCFRSCYPTVSLDGSTVFIGDGTLAVVRAFGVASGVLLWQLAVRSAYAFTAASCGPTASDCLVVLQSGFEEATSLLFVDARSGALLNSTIVLESNLGEFGFPLAAGSVVAVTVDNFVLAYSSVNYTLLWNQTSSGLEFAALYPTGLFGWKTPSILVAADKSLAVEAISGPERWNVSADSLCTDRLPPHFRCNWEPQVAGLLEPQAHALGVVAHCSCGNVSNSSESFTVSRFFALNTSNGAPLWARTASSLTANLFPSAKRTMTLMEEGAANTSLLVYDSESFVLLQEWVVRNTEMSPAASSSRFLFLLDVAPDGAFTVAAFRRKQ